MCTYLGIIGLSLGLALQILILVVQNSFPLSIVGTATASNNFFRQIGSSLGAAIVGSLFVSRLTESLSANLPAGGAGSGTNSLTPAIVAGLPEQVRSVVVNAYNDALTPIFLLLVPLVLVAAVLLMFVVEKPLATKIERNVEVFEESLATGANPGGDLLLTGEVKTVRATEADPNH